MVRGLLELVSPWFCWEDCQGTLRPAGSPSSGTEAGELGAGASVLLKSYTRTQTGHSGMEVKVNEAVVGKPLWWTMGGLEGPSEAGLGSFTLT